jgi:fimbrial chaperone protein
MNTRNSIVVVAAALIMWCPVQVSHASSFSAEPVRVILDAQHRTERMAVKNESVLPVTLLVKAYHWSQDAAGKDLYVETEDLAVFPRVVTLAAGEERLIRVGNTNVPGSVEKAFRVYIEEQPVSGEQAPKGANARILMRLGIPVFDQLHNAEPVVKVTDLAAKKGHLTMSVSNGGNTFSAVEHVIITGVTGKGDTVYDKDLGGFYLLAGSTRNFTVPVPAAHCHKLSKILIATSSEGKERHDVLTLLPGACEAK